MLASCSARAYEKGHLFIPSSPILLAEKRNGAGAHLLAASIDRVRETRDLGADLLLLGARIVVDHVISRYS